MNNKIKLKFTKLINLIMLYPNYVRRIILIKNMSNKHIVLAQMVACLPLV